MKENVGVKRREKGEERGRERKKRRVEERKRGNNPEVNVWLWVPR